NTRVQRLLRERLADALPPQKLRVSLALLPRDAGQVGYLRERLLAPDASPDEVRVIRAALRPHGEGRRAGLWAPCAAAKADRAMRFRAACALADFAPDDGRWHKISDDVVAYLVTENSLRIGPWAEVLRPVRAALRGPLTRVFHDRDRPEERNVAT